MSRFDFLIFEQEVDVLVPALLVDTRILFDLLLFISLLEWHHLLFVISFTLHLFKFDLKILEHGSFGRIFPRFLDPTEFRLLLNLFAWTLRIVIHHGMAVAAFNSLLSRPPWFFLLPSQRVTHIYFVDVIIIIHFIGTMVQDSVNQALNYYIIFMDSLIINV